MPDRARFARPLRAACHGLGAFALVLFLGTSALADVIVLKDGRRFEGTIKSESAKEVVFVTRFGEMRFKPSEISSLERGDTPKQEFDARWKQCKTAKEFYELGVWADGKKLKSQAKKAMKKVRSLDPGHAEANRYLGFVLYKGRWVTEKEHAELVAADEAAEMEKRGLVKHGEEWVTLAAKEKLEAGYTFHEGRWLTEEELKAAKGLGLWKGEWIELTHALAYQHAEEVMALSGVTGPTCVGHSAAVSGPFERQFLQEICEGLDAGRSYFDEQYPSIEGDDLLNGRLAEFYVWGRTNSDYVATVDHLVAMTDTVPAGFGEACKNTHGFVFWEPLGVSSARSWYRPDEDVAGHSYHHWGHILINRRHYDGRLLPPWFDESFSALMEFRIHGRNAVFCISSPATEVTTGGTSAKREMYTFDPIAFRRGNWREALLAALEANDPRLVSFDKLAQRQFGELTLVEIAMGMGITSWLEARGEGALDRFQASLKASAPRAPMRVILKGADRQKRYDDAFGAALKMGWREADDEWRKWFLATKPGKTSSGKSEKKAKR